MRNARPIGAGRTRFIDGPLSAWHFDTNSRSTSPPNDSLCWALATAERSTLATSRATALRLNCNADSAWLMFLPRIRSSTRPAFWAEVRMYFAVACALTIAYAFPPGAAGAAGAADAALSDFAAWPLNWRVGENSPSLWPTMFSVT